MAEKEKVFVYGTLLSGESNNHLLVTSEKLGDAQVEGLEMHNFGPFPACVLALTNEPVVKGEVWEVDKDTFQRLDWLEGYPDFYDRVEVKTNLGIAWVYICENARGKPLIASGDWKNRK